MKLSNGSTIELSSAFDASVSITAISNANPAVASASNSLAAGDVVLLDSGWELADDRAFRVASPTSTDFTLEGLDSTDTQSYPASGGAGKFLAVSTWVSVPDIVGLQLSGGDWGTYQWQTLASRTQKQMPTVKSARTIQLTIADDPTLPVYAALDAAEKSGEIQVLRLNLVGGGKFLFPGYVGFNRIPTLTPNEGMTVTATFMLSGEPVRYAA